MRKTHPALDRLKDLALRDLRDNLFPWWSEHSVDRVNGGFYCQIGIDNAPVEKAERFITLYARLVWTWSAAYRVFGDARYKELAERACSYFLDCFLDKHNGGFVTRVDYKGAVIDDHKYIYGNAFALYGLSEYARVFNDASVKDQAERLMYLLDSKAYDPVYKGYYETMSASWKLTPWIQGVNRLPSDVKTMNTHLHLLEAMTCHLRANPTPYVRAKAREHLYNMLNRIVDHNIHHYYYFQDRQWQCTHTAISYGHDIEGSWLMLEAADALGEPEARRAARDVCVNIARACYDEAFADTSDGGFTTEYDPSTGEKARRYGWWEQCEAVVGFLNAWQETREKHFLNASLKCLEFTLEHFVDHQKGGWFTSVDLSGKPVHDMRPFKSAGPICPYHNGRMGMEVLERVERSVDTALL